MHGTTSLVKQRRVTDYFEYCRNALPAPSIPKSNKAKAAAGICDLPNELLLCIFDQLRWELREFDSARRLYGVCKRFYKIFAPKVFQTIVCHGTRAIFRLKGSLEEGDGIPAHQVKHAHFRYLTLNQITFMAVQEQLVPSVLRLPSLTSLTLENIGVNVELVTAMGQLPNLAFLTYDVAYPNSLLSLNPLFGTFSVDHFQNAPGTPPSKLQSLSVRFMCNDAEFIAFGILWCILYSSRNTIQSINIDFNQCCGWMPVHRILMEDYPSLRRLCLYHTRFAWASFGRFYSVHSENLEHLAIFFRGEPNGDEAIIDQSLRRDRPIVIQEVPGLGRTTTPRHQVWQIDSFAANLGIDPSSNVSAHEISLVRGRWEMLPYITKAHPYIRVLNMWDGSLFLGNTILGALTLASVDLTRLEVLRFNSGRKSLDGLGQADFRPLGVFCDSDTPNSWCRCASCEAGIYTAEGRHRLREEWEDTAWQFYQDQIRRLLSIFPKLKLVEWFLGRKISLLQEVPIPFWEWRIERTETGKVNLKRRLRNWPYSNPFADEVIWSAARGMGSPA